MSDLEKNIYLIDGSGFIFRAYHALPPLTRDDGTPVGAVLGFCNIFLKLLDQNHISKIAVVFDSARQNYRHDIYPAYKANRGETPEDLIPQFPLIREACKAFNITSIELEGYEADDIIATYAKQAIQSGYNVTIVSSDKDLMQLINQHTKMLDPIKNTLIHFAEVEKKFGVSPDQVIDVQALAGDSSDNVPGIPGIGVKTAAELINHYGTLENLLSNTDEIKQPKRRERLVNHKDDAIISKKLVTLCDDVPLQMNINELVLEQPNSDSLYNFLKHQEFNNLISRLEKRGLINKQTSDKNTKHNKKASEIVTQKINSVTESYHTILSLQELKEWLARAKYLHLMAFDTETTSINPSKAELIGFSIALEPGLACYVPLQHTSGQQIKFDDALHELKTVLEDSTTKIVGQNIKYDMRIMLKYGIEINAYEDTMAMSYNINGVKLSNSLDAMALRYCNHEMIKFNDVIKTTGNKQSLFSDIEIDNATQYASEDADYTLRIYHILKQKLVEHKCYAIYLDIDLPLIKLLALMEHKGIKTDANHLQRLYKEFDSKIIAISNKIYEFAETNFNIASPKQLGEILFDKLGLPKSKKNKSGTYATGIDVLESLKEQGYEIAKQLIDWRHYSKLKNTYTESLIEEIDSKGRIHTNYGFNTLTGRLSSADPNLQNIPIKTEDGRKIRKSFIAENGYKLISMDYSQIELRLLAHVAQIEPLIQCFKNKEDIHTITASEVFNKPIKEIDSTTRRAAKAINFGIIYGISAFGLSNQLNISRQEAAEYIAKYNKHYPGILEYMESQKDFARKNSYVETIFGRKCYIKDINATNYLQRAFAERQAINARLQGSAADIIKKSMNQIPGLLQEYNVTNKITNKIANSDVENGQLDLFNSNSKITIGKIALPEGVSLGMPNKNVNQSTVLTQEQEIYGPFYANQAILTGEKIRLMLQVHDELIFEMQESLVDTLVPKIKKIMQSVAYLKVPLIVEHGVGNNWDEAH